MNHIKTEVHNSPNVNGTIDVKERIKKALFQPKGNNIIPPIYLWIGLCALTVFTLTPFIYLVLSSVTMKSELINGVIFTKNPTFENYINIFKGGGGSGFVKAIKNSVYVSVLTTFFSLGIGVFAAYALARIKFPFRMTSLFCILAMQLLPSISIVVPFYMMMRDGIQIKLPFTDLILYHSPPLLDTIWALILAYTTFSLPFVIWLLAGYFQTIPKELEEAAFIDGCSRFTSIIKVILPIAAPGIAATALFTFLGSWDEFMFANAFTQTYESKTLPVVIREFMGKHSIDWGFMTAGGIIASLPPLIISILLYRYIIGGMVAGSIKE
ncbi:carbohydrate ABC transporter membrane protein 2 (CUT1 family) [Scopulibacillus darangshiensis]|uniref:Carbohydrate ABC transporter membrane protein 2 (CUT1 family) n=1 Tax=Scopulibacillus darangshiensis TaxID=442528 RepID=A0A4R2PA62_9BACL|nr:carbohydrate ABC transporter permease [Scopulibacillus darangshiensis]TCP30971.1 carbohydrate ABC transporter membrane protein 2 (CUT1 family) [Scopulibacillus darangshiensis]